MKSMWDYPIFISYPRCGAHYINYMMEVYFNRPRLRISHAFRGQGREDYMWVHDHDIFTKNKKDIVLYLYRDPLDVVFSQVYYNHQQEESEEDVREIVNQYRNHLYYYLLDKKVRSDQYIRYENIVDESKFEDEFKKICDAFSQPFDSERALEIKRDTTKDRIKKVVDLVHVPNEAKRVLNLSDEYSEYKSKWKEKYSGLISDSFSFLEEK